MALFDIMTAEKYFGDILGKVKKDDLLKRLGKNEAQGLRGNNLVTNLINKFKNISIDLDNDKLEKLLGNNGIIYLLSTRPHTTSDSNFVKLVKNKVVNNGELKGYLERKNPSDHMPESIRSVRASLIRYLKLNEKEETEADIVAIKAEGASDDDIKTKFKRNKNKDAVEKLQSLRKANRLKVMATAHLIYLIDKVVDNDSRKNPVDLIKRPSNGQATKEEFEELSESMRKQLKEVIIPKGVTEIPNAFFKDCSELEKVTIPGHVKAIGEEAFFNCEGLKSLIIENGVKKIGVTAFRNCRNLKSVSIPGSVEIIDRGAFISDGIECSGLKEVTIKNGVKQINGQAFMNSGIEKLTVPKSVETIGQGAFCCCTKLESLIIEDGVKQISRQAFMYCRNLVSVTIPRSVETIGQGAFAWCSESMRIEGTANEETRRIIREQITPRIKFQ